MSLPAEIQKVSQGALTVSEQVKMIKVLDSESMARANDGFLIIRKMRKEIASVFSPMEEKAKEAKRAAEESRKEVMKQWEKVEAPLLAAEGYLNGQMSAYKREQDRIRAEEEEKNRQEAIKAEMARRKIEEEEKLKRAAELEAAGAKDEAEQVMAEALAEVEKPMEIYTPQPSTSKIKMFGVAERTNWWAEVFDLKALCLAVGNGEASVNLVLPNESALNKMAIALHEEMNVAGVKAVSETKMVPTGR